MPAHLRHLFLAVVVALLVGCSTSVTWHEGYTKAPYKLTSARVIWVENPSMKMMIQKRAMGAQPTINDADQLNAAYATRYMIEQFQKSVVEQVTAKLAEEGVATGNEITLEITPVVSSVAINEHHTLTTRTTIKEAASNREIWSATIQSTGNFIREDKDIILSNFIDSLVLELKKSGWLIRA